MCRLLRMPAEEPRHLQARRELQPQVQQQERPLSRWFIVRVETPPNSHNLEIFDLTGGGSGSEDNGYPWRVGMIEMESYEEVDNCEDENMFMDCVEPVVDILKGISSWTWRSAC